ncbi:glycoside hydrolase [Thozetella sp. PMI_491]|nr:glycoside hydrolase [Thozetella sp. PMI_491]
MWVKNRWYPTNRRTWCLFIRAAASQVTHLVRGLQYCAYKAGHHQPLLIAIDQENGSLNSLVDESITQFPSALGMATVASPDLTRRAAKAVASELSCVGINWIIGPVLDVLSASRPSPLGVRAFGDDPVTVLTHGVETVRGFKEAGVACCGKHFPSYGDAEFPDGSELSLPSIGTTIEDLQDRAIVPFRACAQVGLDAILVGGCTLNIAGKTTDYACVDRSIVSGILRHECQFEGVVLSECLAMEALYQDIGISQGVSRAISAGCDMVTVCHSQQAQLEGLNTLRKAVRNGSIPLHVLQASGRRIKKMKGKCTSWERALNPQGLARLADLHIENVALANQIYRGAISLVRDAPNNLERVRKMSEDGEILLLTPLIELFPSTATRQSLLRAAPAPSLGQLAPGEDTFQLFGVLLAETLGVKLAHTSYSSNGLRPLHEQLISRASAVIIMTADATRNAYQYGVTKHAIMQCRYQKGEDNLEKPLVVVALSSPHDFLTDKDVQTYICTYDFTMPSLRNVTSLFAGTLKPSSNIPLTLTRRSDNWSLDWNEGETRATWLVESYDKTRDRASMQRLLSRIPEAPPLEHILSLQNADDVAPEKRCFVVRNSSTGVIFGIAVGVAPSSHSGAQIGTVLVDPDRRGVGIEKSLREHAQRCLGVNGSIA